MIMLMNALPRILFANGGILAEIVVLVLYTIVAAAAGVDIYRWFKTKQIQGFEWILKGRAGRKTKSM